MSILRDAMELGYGVDHFIVTGDDFPEDWEDKVMSPEQIKMEQKEWTDIENMVDSIDSEEGWFKRGYHVPNSVSSVGCIDGVDYYHLEKTIQLSEFFDTAYSNIQKKLADFFSYMKENNVSDPNELDSQFEDLEKRLLIDIDDMHDFFYKKGIGFGQKRFFSPSRVRESNHLPEPKGTGFSSYKRDGEFKNP